MAMTNGNANESKMGYVHLGASGLKVSKIIVGCMSYGDSRWQKWVLDEDESLPILKHAYDCGLNTWDTADVYSNGESERVVAKAIKKYSIPRERLVILSKCFNGIYPSNENSTGVPMRSNDGEWVNRVGLSRKHIFDAVEASVERLGTYIDVLQIHRLDRSTPPKEIMRALNDVVEKGWVRYIGASSMAAWEFQNLNWIARTNGWHEFISMQNYHNLLYREEEREMIPYCQANKIGLIPWSPVARGVLARPWNTRETTREKTDRFLKSNIRDNETETDRKIVDRVEEIAKKRGVSMTCIATAWSISKGFCPITGLSSKERVDQAVFNSNYELSREDIEYLEEPYKPKVLQTF